MNHLVIFAHPNGEQSFNKAILDAVVRTSRDLAVDTVVRDLYALEFNPLLSWKELQAAYRGITPAEISHEQRLITQADLITLIYPLWWMGFPAILKGYLDRVLSHGFAYKTEAGVSVGLLGGKKMQHFMTIGNNVDKYRKLGFAQSLCDCLVNGLFNYCGITDIQHQVFGDIHVIDDQARRLMLEDVARQTQQNLTALFTNREQEKGAL